MTQDEALQAIQAHGSISAAARALHISRETVRRRAKGEGCSASPEGAPLERAAPTSIGRTLNDFRATHDKAYIVPNKITDALAKLGDSWLYEAEFIKACGLTPPDVSAFRDQFADYIVEVRQDGRRRTVWAGTKHFAAKLREMTR